MQSNTPSLTRPSVRPPARTAARSKEESDATWKTHVAMQHQMRRDWRRRFRVTRDGKLFLLVLIGIGLAAVSSANNLLYLLLGLMCSLVIINGVMSELSIRQLTIVRRLPLRAQVGKPHLVEVEVYNHKKRVPSYAIEVEDLRRGQPADKRCFFLKISPKSAQVAAYRRTPIARGLDFHTGFRVATRFPFGLFERSREVPALGELVIYPAVDPIPTEQVQNAKGPEARAQIERGHGEEFLGVRLQRPGEDPRDIHWRKTAAANQPVLKERGRLRQAEIVLPLELEREGTTEAEATFERLIREIASRAVAHLKRGDIVLVRTSAGRDVRASKASGADPLLRFLALVQPVLRPDETGTPGSAPGGGK